MIFSYHFSSIKIALLKKNNLLHGAEEEIVQIRCNPTSNVVSHCTYSLVAVSNKLLLLSLANT